MNSWTVPEEYRIWKERMDAVEAKKVALLTANQQKVPSTTSTGKSDTEHPSHTNGKKKIVEDDRPAPVYASTAEATDAFKAMLLDKKVSVYVSILFGFSYIYLDHMSIKCLLFPFVLDCLIV